MRGERPNLKGVRPVGNTQRLPQQKTVSEKTPKPSSTEPQGQPEGPVALRGLLWKNKYHSISFTQIKTGSDQFSSAAPVTFRSFLTLSRQKENA